ncbi:hypothetical protein IMCC9480_1616 [Oxalobacteraceae bacterium IMCC9480]|nr:hypothetical protein IMCC9480_1616 [Oxalobacteraceae bacterium IMCC9480]
MTNRLPVIAGDGAKMQWLALTWRQALGQIAPAGDQQQYGNRRHEREHRAPAERDLQQPANNRCHGRRDTEHHHDLGDHLLRIGTAEAIAHDRLADHHAGTGRHALHRAKHQQPREAGRQRRAYRAGNEDQQRGQNHRPPAERIRQRAVEQRHQRIAEQIDAEGLLDQHRADGELLADGDEGRQVGIGGERAEHGQCGQHQRQGAGRGVIQKVDFLEKICWVIVGWWSSVGACQRRVERTKSRLSH